MDGFVLETFSDLDELRGRAARGARAVATCRHRPDDGRRPTARTAYGTDAGDLRPAARRDWAPTSSASTARSGPQACSRPSSSWREVTDRPLSAQPNAGLPRDVGDRKIYMASPEYMASYARRMVEAGARFVGGCCGTTPEHIKAIARLRAERRRRGTQSPSVTRARRRRQPAASTPVPLAERSRLGRQARATASSSRRVEIVPPKGVDPAPMFEQVPRAQGGRRGRGQRARRPAGAEPHGRAARPRC